jgi:hypothetical protein
MAAMLKLFSVVGFYLLFSVSSLGQVMTDCQVEGLKGKVKTLQEDNAMIEGKPGEWKELRRSRVSTISWDKEGYEIERIVGTVDRPLFKVASSYNAAQKTRTQNRYDFAAPGGVKGFILDSKGNPIKPPPASPQTQASDGAVINEILYKYDNEGNRTETLIYEGQKPHGKLFRRRVFSWDTNGKIKEEQWYDKGGKPEFKFVYKYDTQGNEIESLMIQDKIKNTSRTIYSEYQFDSQGNWISRVIQEYPAISSSPQIKTVIKTYRQITYWE